MQELNILHVVTSLTGGAGKAASAIQALQKQNGLSSEIISRTTLDIHKRNGMAFFSKSIHSKIATVIGTNIVQKSENLVSLMNVSFARYFEQELKVSNIIHMHSVYNLLSNENIFELLKANKKILFHLHDMRFFTGGCHHSFACSGYMMDCNECPYVRRQFSELLQKRFVKWRDLIQEQTNIVIVAHSEWIREKADASSVFRKKRILVLPNKIDRVEKLDVDNDLSKFFNPDMNEFVIGFCSADISSTFKNFVYFVELIKEFVGVKSVNVGRNIKVLIIGRGEIGDIGKNPNVIRVYSSSPGRIAWYLSKLDVLVVPSLAENNPNVIHEALLQGTRVIASNVGGIPETLRRYESCRFLSGNLSEDCRQIIQMMHDTIYNRAELSENHGKHLDDIDLHKEYLKIYAWFQP